MAECPHRHIQYCPLHIAGHVAGLVTCMTGDWARGCAVNRGTMSYLKAFRRLDKQRPEWLPHCQQAEKNHESWERMKAAQEQRTRNLRVNGIH